MHDFRALQRFQCQDINPPTNPERFTNLNKAILPWKIALALNVSTDFLLFEEHERGPSEELVLQFEVVSQLPPKEQQVIKEVLDSLIIKYQTRRWNSTREQQAENQ